MQYDWIIDVIADLRSFARSNGLPTLAAQLDETKLVAFAEIASRTEGALGGVYDESSDGRGSLGRVGAR